MMHIGCEKVCKQYFCGHDNISNIDKLDVIDIANKGMDDSRLYFACVMHATSD